jgi:hypothetical protein
MKKKFDFDLLSCTIVVVDCKVRKPINVSIVHAKYQL